jgi:hypothetical protein
MTEISKEGEEQGNTNSKAFYELRGLRNQKEKMKPPTTKYFLK